MRNTGLQAFSVWNGKPTLHTNHHYLQGLNVVCRTKNATLEVILEAPGFNNSLAGYMACPNGDSHVAKGGRNASTTWTRIYLQEGMAVTDYIKSSRLLTTHSYDSPQ